VHPIDYVIDCADGVTDKAAIVHYCVLKRIPIVVSGGAGGITDPTLIRVSDMARALGCTLLMRVRKKMRQSYGYPSGTNMNKYGDKVDRRWGILAVHSLPTGVPRQSGESNGSGRKCDAIYGNTCFGTGTIGLALSSVAINAIAMQSFTIPKQNMLIRAAEEVKIENIQD
jgi:tRNA threonylcarbamoyladenosine dehydratase